MEKAAIEEGLKAHDRALHIKDGWIREPCITLVPDGYYYLTGTTRNPRESCQAADSYDTGLGLRSLVGYQGNYGAART